MFLLILERMVKVGVGRKREKYQLTDSHIHPDQGLACNLGMCPDRQLNPQPFDAWDNTPTY